MSDWVSSCHIANLPALRDGLKIAELPAGLLTGVRALKQMGVPVHVRHAYDILGCLKRQDLTDFSDIDRQNMFWGKLVGDILNIEVTAMEIVHWLLSGPCCPPWSTLGDGGLMMVSLNYVMK